MLRGKFLRLLALFLWGGWLQIGSANASIILPPVNPMTTGPAFNDFYVYPLELIAQCAAAGDPRCLPSSGLPVASSTGAVDPQVVIYQQQGGNDNYAIPGATGAPFHNQLTDMVDNPFRAPSGSHLGDTSYAMSASNEPDGASAEFTGDLMGTWEAKLSSIVGYLTSAGVQHDLVFLFDNNEEGSTPVSFTQIWGQINITDAAGVSHACYELSNFGSFTGCHGTDPLLSSYVTAGQYCVDEVTGLAIPAITVKATCQAAGHYWLSNNIGSSTAEFAAYAPDLNTNLNTWASAGYYMSVNMKLDGLSDGAEQLFIASDACLSDGCRRQVPEPATLWLFGLALLVMAGISRRHH